MRVIDLNTDKWVKSILYEFSQISQIWTGIIIFTLLSFRIRD